MRRSISFFMGMCVALLVTVCVPMVVFASFGLNETAGAAGLTGYGNSVPKIVGNVIGTLLSMISVLFFVLVLYGGILWMTARGNSDQTGKALNTIIGATIGIVIVMGAYALTNFVFSLGTPSSPTPTPAATPVCGNGAIEQGEQCDGDRQCTAQCTLLPAQCGNGVEEAGEACDDGNTANGDGCSNACAVESGWNCNTEEPSVCELGPDL